MSNKPTSLFLIAILAATTLSGCLIRTRGRSNNNSTRVVSCGKHEAWDGSRCVRQHPGNGRGPVVRDHRR